MSLLDCTCIVRALKAGLFETRGWDPSAFGVDLTAEYLSELGCFTDAACDLANASAQYLGRASSAAIEMGDIAYTLGIWFKSPLAVADGALLYKYAAFGAQPGEYGITADAARVTFYLYENPSGFKSVFVATPTANVWHFLLCWHDPVANRIYIQLDDGAVASTATTNPAAAGNPSAPLNVGSYANNNTPSYDFDGPVGRLSMHKRLLTSAERTWLYNAGAGRFAAEYGEAGTDGSDLLTSVVDVWDGAEKTGVVAGRINGLDLSRTNAPGVAAGPGEGACIDRSPCKRSEDQSGNGHHRTQATIGYQPIWTANFQNGLPALVYDGVDDYLTCAGFAFDQPCTYGFAGSTGDGYVVDSDDPQSGRVFQRTAATTLRMYAGATFDSTVLGMGTFRSYVTVYDGAASVAAQDGVEATGAAGAVNGTGVRVGISGGSPAVPAQVNEGSLVLVGKRLSAAERSSLHLWQKTRYGTP